MSRSFPSNAEAADERTGGIAWSRPRWRSAASTLWWNQNGPLFRGGYSYPKRPERRPPAAARRERPRSSSRSPRCANRCWCTGGGSWALRRRRPVRRRDRRRPASAKGQAILSASTGGAPLCSVPAVPATCTSGWSPQWSWARTSTWSSSTHQEYSFLGVWVALAGFDRLTPRWVGLQYDPIRPVGTLPSLTSPNLD